MKYTIAPYNKTYSAISSDADSQRLKAYLDRRFRSWRYTEKARYAIEIALRYYRLSPDDVVTIFTTSGNFYISSCVTNAIENVCKWSRDLLPETKVILVNHEFGYPYENISELKRYNLPIIEDCAYAFFSESKDGRIGKVGDFAIYSLPKAFPVGFGGILVSNNDIFELNEFVTPKQEEEIIHGLAGYIQEIGEIKARRLENYEFLRVRLSHLGVVPFFDIYLGVVPGVFMFKWHSDIDYPALKIYMQSHGVECSVFYGQHAFFIPMHHLLTQSDLLYFCELLANFIKDNEIFKH